MKKFQDKTSANDKSIGFDYQYYYFLYLLLGLEEGQAIGIEVKDDLHIDLSNGNQILLQLKHTLQTSASGAIINITERDSDLWKTIYNWINVINDENDGRKNMSDQIIFIEKTIFILVSNKSSNSNNKFLVKISEFNKGKLIIDDIVRYLKELHSTTESAEIKGYMSLLLKQPSKWLSKFFSKLHFELDQDDLIGKVKSRIKAKQVKETKIDDVFHAVDSKLREEYYFNTKSLSKTLISFEEFYKRYHIFFDKGRNNKLPIRKLPIHFDKPLKEQVFIQQLLEIYAIEEKALDKMLTLTEFMLQMYNHFDFWEKDGLITKQQIKDFNDDCVRKWENTHEEAHRKILLNIRLDNQQPEHRELIEAALKCLDEIKKKELVFDENPLDVEMSNGQFYLLSNEPRIGWHLNWEEKYKK
ncbi:ABC-three component system protein [Paenibacillus elgii]|uniref:ABC-three component system protein n=1 Tax=Paenibacillus elgii TaxID=189691 RepID=UPI000248D376|nr:ABC-three component system protein [Paenibacillus elgii]